MRAFKEQELGDHGQVGMDGTLMNT